MSKLWILVIGLLVNVGMGMVINWYVQREVG